MLDFPNTPYVGQQFSALNVTWQWDGGKWTAMGIGTTAGVPTAYAGRVPMYYDTTTHKLWLYDAGWKGVVVS